MSGPSSSEGMAISHADVYTDILSHAVTGELVGMVHFAKMADMFTNVADKMEAVEHANGERTHALAFQAAARDLGLELTADLDAPYWRRVREAFDRWAEQGDLVACVAIQELMLESLAVAMYRSVGAVAEGRLGKTFATIAEEEAEHLRHAVEFLRQQRAEDPAGFDDKMSQLHGEVMTVLAEMIAREDPKGHCGICCGDCVKPLLPKIHLDIATMRGNALNAYLTALDEIGLPGERTVEWIANLPV